MKGNKMSLGSGCYQLYASLIAVFTIVTIASTLESHTNRTKINDNRHVPVYPIYGHYLSAIAANLASRLRDISNDELGITVVQEIYDSLEYTSVPYNDTDKVYKMSDKLTSKLISAINILNETRKMILNNAGIGRSTIYPCPPDSPQPPWDFHLQYDRREIEVLNQANYATTQEDVDGTPINLTQVLQDKLDGLVQGAVNIKQQYVLLTTDSATDPVCSHYDESRLRYLYLKSMQKKSKYIVLLVDHGNSLSSMQLQTAKAMAKYMIELLTPNDYIGVISLSEVVQTVNGSSCDSESKNLELSKATSQHKETLMRFVDGMAKSKEATNHTLGFQEAFKMLNNTLPESNNGSNVMLLYISRGLLSSIMEARTVLETIAKGLQILNNPIIINTCAIIPDAKRVMYEKDFLRDVALQNFSKYSRDLSSLEPLRKKGLMQVINSSHGLGRVATTFYNTLLNEKRIVDGGIYVHLPYWDPVSKDISVSITLVCGIYGIVGMDLYLSDLAEDVTYFSSHQFAHAFIINRQGITIMHPSFPRPIIATDVPKATDILYLETAPRFKEVRNAIMSDTNGSYMLNSTSSDNSSLTYTWKWSMNIYCLCIVSVDVGKRPGLLQRVALHSGTTTSDKTSLELLHHRIDLIPPASGSLCRHLKQVATLETGTLYFSASSFQAPFSYLRSNRASDDISLHTVQSYMAYIKDGTRLLANPGLLSAVRSDVSALLLVLTYLKRQHMHGSLKKYVVRRYVATASGVIEVFPGTALDADLEPNRRPWYRRAIEHPGKIVLTEPYLDAGGSGYIVTLSHTVFEGKAAALHSAHDSAIAVIAMDFTLGFFYKLLLESAPFCSHPNVKCFLMDDKGYLISHPSLINPNGRGPFERLHITHKESLVAHDILNHKGLVKKELCNNFADRTIQRYYQFNTSLSEVLTNVVHGEHCVKYQVTALAGTNIFLGMVNSSFDGGAFCPCNMLDRSCLNCNRMEQKDCECPCECPLNVESLTCSTNMNIIMNSNDIPVCQPVPEQSTILEGNQYQLANQMKTCLRFHCELHVSHSDCLGILGCEWCQIDIDGETPLMTPFCTSQATCFSGVLGSVTPYGDHFGSVPTSDLLPPAYSTVGPVAGAVVALCLVLALAIYCYRQNVSHIDTTEHLYADSGPDHCGMRMSNLHCDNTNEDDVDHKGKLLQKSDNISPASPYRMSTGYRRPAPTAGSDHGYSTMTPHDESEHLCFALAEPLLINNGSNSRDVSSLSDACSMSTSVSSPRHNYNVIKTEDRTVSPSPVTSIHQVLAPVTVHRIMETA